jgi:hypothetical protein
MAATMYFLDESPMLSEKYNSLPHIDEAKTISTDQVKALNQLLGLIRAHHLEAKLSIHLIHKHFDIPAGRVMVYETIEGKNCADFQISSPRVPDSCENLKGLFFRADVGGKMEAYEYTTDSLVDISGHDDFVKEMSDLIMHLGVQDVFALTLKNPRNPTMLHEFEMPDMSSTILVQDESWVPGADAEGTTSTSTDWGFPMEAEKSGDYAVLTRCTVTRSTKHYEITKAEPDVDAGDYTTLTSCVASRGGKHHTASKAEENELSDDYAILTRCTVTRSTKHYEITKGEPDVDGIHEERSRGFVQRRGIDTQTVENGGLLINGEPLPAGTEAYNILCQAREIISAF